MLRMNRVYQVAEGITVVILRHKHTLRVQVTDAKGIHQITVRVNDALRKEGLLRRVNVAMQAKRYAGEQYDTHSRIYQTLRMLHSMMS